MPFAKKNLFDVIFDIRSQPFISNGELKHINTYDVGESVLSILLIKVWGCEFWGSVWMFPENFFYISLQI